MRHRGRFQLSLSGLIESGGPVSALTSRAPHDGDPAWLIEPERCGVEARTRGAGGRRGTVRPVSKRRVAAPEERDVDIDFQHAG